jgi:calmodulin
VELTPEEMEEVWMTIFRDPELPWDPELAHGVTEEIFEAWFNSGTPISDKVQADDDGALLAIGTTYKTRHTLLGRGKSVDAEQIIIEYKDDVEQEARETGAKLAVLQDEAWRDGRTVLGEIDAEDLVSRTVDVEGIGRVKVLRYEKGKYYLDKVSAKGEPIAMKLPSKKVTFAVLDEEFVGNYIAQTVNKAIARWARKESKIRKKFDTETRENAMAMKEAWQVGSDFLDPDHIVDQRIDITGMGMGTVVDYLDEEYEEDDDLDAKPQKNKDYGKHVIEFDTGRTETMALDAMQFRCLNDKFVQQFIREASMKWTISRAKRAKVRPVETLDSEQEEENPKSKKLKNLGAMKPGLLKSSDKTLSKQEFEDEQKWERDEAKLASQMVVLKGLFAQFSENGDDLLEKEEFENLAFELGFRGSATQLDEAWEEVDTTGTGEIGYSILEEFFKNDLVISISANLLRNQLVKRIDTYKMEMMLLTKLFQKFDANKDGTLDLDEWIELTKALNFSGDTTALRESFQEVDLDDSGTIDWGEFRKFFTSGDIDLGETSELLRELLLAQVDEQSSDIDTLRRVFAKHDPENRGYVEAFDFETFGNELGYSGTKDELEDLFAAMDTNHDGLIDWDEYTAFFSKESSEGGEAAADMRRSVFDGAHDTSDLRVLRKMFEKEDTNTNGQLDLKEFERLCKALGFLGTDVEVTQAFRTADSGGGGAIDWEEFRGWYQAKNPDSVMRQLILQKQKEENKYIVLKTFFDKMDKDKSGDLDRAEFKALAKAINLDARPKQLEAYFKQIDYDRSGTIDFDEFKEWYSNNDDDEILKARLAFALGSDKKTMQKAATLRNIYNQIDSSQAGEVTVHDMLQVARRGR